MATNPENVRSHGGENVERLKRALKECREQLAHAEAMLRAATKQDNEPLR